MPALPKRDGFLCKQPKLIKFPKVIKDFYRLHAHKKEINNVRMRICNFSEEHCRSCLTQMVNKSFFIVAANVGRESEGKQADI